MHRPHVRPAQGPRRPPSLARLAAGLLALVVCWPATAQDSSSREREALRRVQSALQQAQQQRDVLQADKATLERAQAEQATLARQQQDKLAASQAELRRLRAAEAQQLALQAQWAAERQAAAAQQAQSAQALSQAESRLADAQRLIEQLRSERDERSAANRVLVGKLEAATLALAESTARNRQLHAVGQEAVARLRGLSPYERAVQGDPVLGLTAVRLASEGEDLLQRLDAQRQPDAAVMPP